MRVQIGDLFESDAQTIVNTVNCVGVMGKGVALEFKKRFPEMFTDYAARCAAGEVRLGEPYLYQRSVPPSVLNFPTKDHWRSVARLSDIIAGLEYLTENYRRWGITSIAVPPLGCGQGQLDWSVVGPSLYSYLRDLDIPVDLYAPYGTPEWQLSEDFLGGSLPRGSQDAPGTAAWRLNAPWVALAEIVGRIDREPLHWPIGRTIFQKIAYFATQSGLPTGLVYERASFGPFAKGLKAVTTRLVNNGVLHEERIGRMFAVRPGPTFDDAVRAHRAELDGWEHIIDRTTDLFLRISRNTRQAEVAATVHYAATVLTAELGANVTEAQVLDGVRAWKQQRLPDQELAIAIRSLNTLGWITVQPSDQLPVPSAIR